MSAATKRLGAAAVAVALGLAVFGGVSPVAAGGQPKPNTTTTTTTVAPATTTAAGTSTGPATSTTTTLASPTGSDSATTVGTSMAEVVAQIGADRMWAAGYTGAGVDVAVIDTGVAPVAELSTTRVVVGPDLSLEGGVDRVAGLDTYGHGTHMIGIIAGRTPGADPLHPRPGDFFGVAPDAGIVSVKVADHTGAVDVSQVIAAIDWVVQNRTANGLNIRVLNLSYNTTGTQAAALDPLSKAVENAWRHGIVVVVSAGNEGRSAHTLANPATNPYVIAVSAAREKNGTWHLPSWAPTGDGVRDPDLVAPGVSIRSLRVPGSRIDVQSPRGRVSDDSRLFLGSGTSQAAAVTSGAIALMLEQRPNLSPDEIKSRLTLNAVGAGYPTKLQGHGAIDVIRATRKGGGPSKPQGFAPATGLGTLDAARGQDRVTIRGTVLTGEYTVTGAAWNPPAWVAASERATAWTGTDAWPSGSSWSGSSWSGSSWSGSSWSGSSWSGSSWSGSSWSGSSWSGSSWSGSSWSGSSWSGSSWSGSSWSGSSWSGSSWA